MLPNTKSNLHPRNKHRSPYDFPRLIDRLPSLGAYVSENKYGNLSIDFFNPAAVLELNRALLKLHYGIDSWSIPEGYLCPPIPGRADYIHNVADLIEDKSNAQILDIGVGANCIYPLIGCSEYGWSFVASDTDTAAIENCKQIIKNNSQFHNKIDLRLQTHKDDILFGILKKDEYFNATICNPPFYSSKEEASKATHRKLKNLKSSKTGKLTKNFGGVNNELWCKGGEKTFIKKLINESVTFQHNCKWFTSLVSNQNNLVSLQQSLDHCGASQVKILEMSQGQKKSRIIAWSFA